MTLKQTPPLSDFDLYRSHFNQILNQRHELILLGKAIDWSIFDREFGPLYDAAHGRPDLPTRLMVGLHFLKHIFNESDDLTCAKWAANQADGAASMRNSSDDPFGDHADEVVRPRTAAAEPRRRPSLASPPSARLQTPFGRRRASWNWLGAMAGTVRSTIRWKCLRDASAE